MPLSAIAVEKSDAAMLDAVAAGLCAGAEMAGISISGGETSQLKDIIRGFDLVGMAVGKVALDRVIDGSAVKPGDIVIGVKSNGVHSNGFSLARKAFTSRGRMVWIRQGILMLEVPGPTVRTSSKRAFTRLANWSCHA